MSIAAPKPCARCSALVYDGTTRCAAHKPVAWQSRPDIKRTSGRKLQRQRSALFTREPLCRVCREEGRVAPAVIRDHIIPLGENGSDDDANIQPLCQDCSDAKTERERLRGVAGSRHRMAGPGQGGGGEKSGKPQPETDRLDRFSCAGVLMGGVRG